MLCFTLLALTLQDQFVKSSFRQDCFKALGISIRVK